MLSMDEDNYKEAVEASFRVSISGGIGVLYFKKVIVAVIFVGVTIFLTIVVKILTYFI